MNDRHNIVTAALDKAPASIFNAYVIIAAFMTYFSMYAFRRPFAVGTFEGILSVPLLGEVDYKIALIIAQVMGYTLSKFTGIKVVSEIDPGKRALAIIVLITWAELALVGFAMTPSPVNILFLFLNGLPLGMIWGMVFGFLEGRQSTELLGAGLSASYIVASGAVKSVGSWVMTFGISEYWMPAVTGLLFFPLILLFVQMLRLIPRPSAEDRVMRMERKPMDARARRRFFGGYSPGLLSLTVLYMLLTAYRDFRDNFAREIWDALGYGGTPAVYALSELPVALGVLIALAFLIKVKDNRKAFNIMHYVMLGGTLLIGFSTLGYQTGIVAPAWWMILVGLGLYLAYVPYGAMLFDRLIAMVGFTGTAGFMIYVTDAFGYLGSVGLLLYRNFGQHDLSWLNFFIGFSYVSAIICSVFFAYSLWYFRHVTSRSWEPVNS